MAGTVITGVRVVPGGGVPVRHDATVVLDGEGVVTELVTRGDDDGRGAGRRGGEQEDGLLLVPGAVDVHLDNLRERRRPRATVDVDPATVVVALDAECAAAGTAVVCIAARCEHAPGKSVELVHAIELAAAVEALAPELACDWPVHARVEVTDDGAVEALQEVPASRRKRPTGSGTASPPRSCAGRSRSRPPSPSCWSCSAPRSCGCPWACPTSGCCPSRPRPGRSERIRSSFPGDTAAAFPVVVEADADAAVDPAALASYAADMSEIHGVARVEGPDGVYQDGVPVNDASHAAGAPRGPARYVRGGTAWLEVVPSVELQSRAGEQLVEDIRDLDPGFDTLVGGSAAQLVDTEDALLSRLPVALAIVAVTTLVLPILMFCIAFGLSMDYEVFLLSRIKEEHDRTGANAASVALGLERTGRIVSAAAALLAITFIAFGTAEVSFLKLFGVGLALAVLMDATVIRGLPVPAFMRLAGPANWWAPPALRRIHRRIGIADADPRELAPQPAAPHPEPVEGKPATSGRHRSTGLARWPRGSGAPIGVGRAPPGPTGAMVCLEVAPHYL